MALKFPIVCMGFQVIVLEGVIHEDLRAIITSLKLFGFGKMNIDLSTLYTSGPSDIARFRTCCFLYGTVMSGLMA